MRLKIKIAFVLIAAAVTIAAIMQDDTFAVAGGVMLMLMAAMQ